MNRYEETQYYLIVYMDALQIISEKSRKKLDIDAIERYLLRLSKTTSCEIAVRVSDLVKYNHASKRHGKINIDYVSNEVNELYYLLSIANQQPYYKSQGYSPISKTDEIKYPRGSNKKETLEKCSFLPKDETIKISEMSRGAKYIYESNPFCIFGISCTSKKSDAQVIIDKIELASTDGITAEYTTHFDFETVEKPNRSLANLKMAIENIDDISYRWLWIREGSIYQKTWKACKVYHEERNEVDYDRLIVVYLSLLIHDPKMELVYYWNLLLSAIDMIYKMDDQQIYSILKPSLPADVSLQYNSYQVATSFRSTILKPFLLNIECTTEDKIIQILKYIKEKDLFVCEVLLDKMAEIVFALINNRIDEIDLVLKEITASNKCTPKQIDDLETAVDLFFNYSFAMIKDNVDILKTADIWASDKIIDRIQSSIWNSTKIMLKNGLVEKACKYDCMTYFYYSQNQQEQVTKLYPYRMQTLPDSVYTYADCLKAIREAKRNNNRIERFRWLHLATQKGNAHQQYKVGLAYESGDGVSRDCIDNGATTQEGQDVNLNVCVKGSEEIANNHENKLPFNSTREIKSSSKHCFMDEPYKLYDDGVVYIEFCKFNLKKDEIEFVFNVINCNSKFISISALMRETFGGRKLCFDNVCYVKHNGTKYCKFKISNVPLESLSSVEGYLIVYDPHNIEIARTRSFLINTNLETRLQTCKMIEDDSIAIEDIDHAEVGSRFSSGRDVNVSRKTSSTFMDEPTNIGTSLYDSDDAFVGFLNFEIDDNRALFNFWIRNKSDKTISVALRNVYVDEKRDFLYISLGQFNPGETSFKSHWFPSIIPISYYSIKSCIYIYDEGGNCMSKGDAFRINVDFDYNTSSVENGD